MFPNDPMALALKKDAQAGKDAVGAEAKRKQDYDRFMSQGKAALTGKKYDEAVKEADEALKLFPGDAAATALKKDALAAKDALTNEAKKKDFDRLIASGKAALAGKKYDEAIKDADDALKLFPNDPTALALKKDAQTGKDTLAGEAKKKQDYDRLVTSGKAALAGKKFDEAIRDADEALNSSPTTRAALTLKKDAQAGKDNARR